MEPKWSVSLFIVACVMSFFDKSGVAAKWTVCPPNNQQYLSLNYTLLPLENVKATSEDVNGHTEYLTEPGASHWCSGDITPDGEHINITFTETIVLTSLQSGGFVNAYVNNFTILFSNEENKGTFQPHGLLEKPQHFVVEGLELRDATFTMVMPIVANKLQMSINGGLLDPFDHHCWELKLFGCTLMEAVTIEEDGSGSSGSGLNNGGCSSSQTAVDPTPEPVLRSGCSSPMPAAETEWLSRTSFVVIVVPLAIMSVTLSLAVVVLACILCVKLRSASKIGSRVGGVTLRTMANGKHEHDYVRPSKLSMPDEMDVPEKFLYDIPRPLVYDVPRSARSRSSTAGTPDSLQNSIYDRPRVDSARMVSPSEDETAVYEPIPDGGFSNPLPVDEDRDYDDIPELPTAYAIMASSTPRSSGSSGDRDQTSTSEGRQSSLVETHLKVEKPDKSVQNVADVKRVSSADIVT